jgi:PAS domain S-box-containing protein
MEKPPQSDPNPVVQILMAAFEPIEEAVTIAAPNGYIIETNPAVERVYGWSANDLKGFHPMKFCPNSPKYNWKELSKTIWDCVAETGEWNGAVINEDKDGNWFPILLRVRRIQIGKETFVLSFARKLPREAPWGLPNQEARVFEALGKGTTIKQIGSLLGRVRRNHTDEAVGPEVGSSAIRTMLNRIQQKIRRQNCPGCPRMGCPLENGGPVPCKSRSRGMDLETLKHVATLCFELGWRSDLKLKNTEILKHLPKKKKKRRSESFNA